MRAAERCARATTAAATAASARWRRPMPPRSAPGWPATAWPSAMSCACTGRTTPAPMPERKIVTEALARVEGEGALHVRLRDGRVEDVRLRIYEPPRFFEAFLRGRAFTEVPDITARICGICPVAYQTSAMAAMEHACGVTVDPQVRALRRMLYFGEWVESHGLHVFFLHAPDFLGYDNAFAMAKDHRAIVERALHLKKT